MFFWGDVIGEISSVWLSLILASIALTFLSPIVAMRFSEELLLQTYSVLSSPFL